MDALFQNESELAVDNENRLPSSLTSPQMVISRGCVVCGPEVRSIEYSVREVMFRTGESFLYQECTSCGSLGLSHVPENLSKYYDSATYYSFGGLSERWNHPRFRHPISRRIARINTAIYLRTGHGFGKPYTRLAGIKPKDRILDIGCGEGANLFILHVLGYRHLCGIDPFLGQDRVLAPGVPLLRSSHNDAMGEYDWVMMHHAFEHVPDPLETLASVKRLLSPRGHALIRMPLMGSHAWRTYGRNWVQIDAPRHLHIYTIAGFRRLVEKAGFTIEKIFFDSDSFQFWGSEMAAMGELYTNGPNEQYGATQMREWTEQAETLNRAADGDQVGYVIRAL